MKRPSKLLLLKNHRDHPFARSWITDEGGVYGRSVDDATQLGAMLQVEHFDAVVIDQRESDDDLIETIQGVHQYQPHAKLIVLSDTVALPQVVQAMRYNVREIFQPPLSLAAVATRIERDMMDKPGGRARGEREALAHWQDVLHAIEGRAATGDPATQLRAAHGVAHPGDHDSAELRKALDERTRELGELRLQLEKANAAQVREVAESDRTSRSAKSSKVQDARIRELESELEATRARLLEVEGAASSASGSGSAECVALQNEIEFHVGNAARLQEQLAMSTIGHAEMTKEVARLGAIEVKFQRSESQLAALRVEHATTLAALRDAEAKLTRSVREAGVARTEAMRAGEAQAAAEAELAAERERIAAETKSIAAERESIAMREAEATALQAKAQKERGAVEKTKAAVERRGAELDEQANALNERSQFIADEASRLAALGEEIDAGVAAVIDDAANMATRIQMLAEKRAGLREQILRVNSPAAVV